MEENDHFLARQLQEKFDKESATFLAHRNESIGSKQTNSTGNGGSQTLSVIDPSWETTDPNPDVRALFLEYNDQYFGGKLAGVEVRWSPRMTLCAGICHYEGRGGLCSIRLSVPLLKLRPRKDLVETLLHEMIHAYLFVTDNDRDRDGHGPNFQKHMHRINKESGANITIYHSFHDEVDNYRQHWWRCNGPCRNQHPYYGWVKRAMNRAPSANDFWWEEHARSCGGTYTKVKEPEGYGDKKKGGKEQKGEKSATKDANMDIRSFLGKGNILDSSRQGGGGNTSVLRKNATSTVTKSGQTSLSSSVPSASSSTHANVDTTSNAERTKSDFSTAASDWGGGIWTSEKNSFSQPSGNAQTLNTGNILPKNPTSGSSQQKNWTVVETKNDKEVTLRSDSSDKVNPDKSDNTGQVLGRDSGDGLNWLARMRKQWASEDKNHMNGSKSVSSPQKANSTSLPCQQNEWKMVKPANTVDVVESFDHKTQSAGRSKPSTSSIITETESNNHGHHSPLISCASDDSLHSSFHVSSCEEDNWPTPEKYKMESKTAKMSSKNKSNRKRTFIDLVSSDEEDFDLQTVSKRAKAHTKANSSGHAKRHDSGLNSIFQPIRTKDTKKSEERSTGSNATSQPDVTRGIARNRKDSETEIFNDAYGSTSELETTTSTSEANVSGNTASSSSVSEDHAAPRPLVACPACQRKVPTDDINAHLDVCLS